MPPRSSSTSTSSTEPLVRKALLIESLGASFVQGQQCLGGPRRDTALFKDEQLKRLSKARSLLDSSAGKRRVVIRPSLLTSPAGAAAFALGAATALASSALPSITTRTAAATAAPLSKLKGLVSRALEGAASDAYNDSLSALHQARASSEARTATKESTNGDDDNDNEQQLRAVLRELRDAKRAPDFGGGFAASSNSNSSWEGADVEGGEEGTKSSLDENVAAAISAAEAGLRASAGLLFRASEKL